MMRCSPPVAMSVLNAARDYTAGEGVTATFGAVDVIGTK